MLATGSDSTVGFTLVGFPPTTFPLGPLVPFVMKLQGLI